MNNLLTMTVGIGARRREQVIKSLTSVCISNDSADSSKIGAGLALAEWDKMGLGAAKILVEGVSSQVQNQGIGAQIQVSTDEINAGLQTLLGPPSMDVVDAPSSEDQVVIDAVDRIMEEQISEQVAERNSA